MHSSSLAALQLEACSLTLNLFISLPTLCSWARHLCPRYPTDLTPLLSFTCLQQPLPLPPVVPLGRDVLASFCGSVGCIHQPMSSAALHPPHVEHTPRLKLDLFLRDFPASAA